MASMTTDVRGCSTAIQGALWMLLLVLSSPTDARQAAAGPRTGKTELERSTVVPLTLQGHLAPILVVIVDGVPVRLRFDLGESADLVLQQSALDSIRASPTGETARLQGIDGPFEAPMFRASRVQIGGAVFRDATARQDAARQAYVPDTETQGFLGTGLLKDLQLVIDYENRMMTLVAARQPSRAGLCRGTEMRFSANPKWGGEPVTDVDTDLGRLTLWWDTGAPVSVLRKELIERADGRETFTSKHLRLGTRDFGPWQFQLWGNMNLPGFDGFIGSDFFAKHLVCVDFPSRRIFVR